MPAPSHEKRDPRKKPRLSPEEHQKAKQLHERNGIPFGQAVRVVRGQVTLNEVVLRMLRRDKIDKLVQQHGIGRALAGSIVDGKIDQEHALLKFRARWNVIQNRERSALDEARQDGRRVALMLDPDLVRFGRIRKVDTYEFDFEPEDGPPETVHKTMVHCVFDPAEVKTVARRTKVDEKVQARDLAPQISAQQRLHFKHAVLQKILESEKPCTAVTRRGKIFRGKIQRYGLYEMGLKLDRGPFVTLFRHALEKLDGP